MNNWKEHANLFANGKFKVKHDDGEIKDITWYNLGNIYVHKKYLTLIARPISDMGDDEKAKWKSFIYENSGNMIKRYAEQTAYLLSISVYPFNQDDFKTGQVININEV